MILAGLRLFQWGNAEAITGAIVLVIFGLAFMLFITLILLEIIENNNAK